MEVVNKLRKKQVTILRRSVSVTAITLLLIAGLASAGLLTYYGKITTTVTTQQAIKLDGKQCDPDYDACTVTDIISEPAPGGETFCFKHWIENQASVDIPVKFDTAYIPELTNGEIKTKIYKINPTTTLTLENKDPNNWNVISDSTSATLVFDTVNKNFTYSLMATGLQSDIEYKLIYYADFAPPRFSNWGGNNPGALIATVMTDGSGNINVSGIVNLDMNLPSSPDWNINPNPDYCLNHDEYDNYLHCKGAKIWLIPSTDYDDTNKKLTTWNPSNYLFETDLVTYFDCDLGVESYLAGMGGTIVTGNLTTVSKQNLPILVCYDFAIDIKPGTYTITTEIKPA